MRRIFFLQWNCILNYCKKKCCKNSLKVTFLKTELHDGLSLPFVEWPAQTFKDAQFRWKAPTIPTKPHGQFTIFTKCVNTHASCFEYILIVRPHTTVLSPGPRFNVWFKQAANNLARWQKRGIRGYDAGDLGFYSVHAAHCGGAVA